MKIRILSAIVLTLGLFAAVAAQPLDKAKLDQFFDRLAEKNKAMGSFTATKDGNVVYSRTIGFSEINDKGKKAATAATRYRVGSITKVFTAAMIFQLVEEGKLKLTDTLDKFFPQIPNAKQITIAQMLAHRSGIHSFTNDQDFGTWLMNPKTKDEIVALIAKAQPDFAPGEKTAYSNTGFILLGYIIEKIDGKPYQTVLKERITSKLDLKDTYLSVATTDLAKNESLSFKYKDGWKQEIETHMSIPGGAGAIISTPRDLTKFIHALFSLKVVSQASLDQMMKDKMGLQNFQLEGKTLYGHGGGIDGFRSILMYLPEEKLAVSYTANAVAYPPNAILLGFFDIYRNRPFTVPTFETVAVSPEVLEKYVGVYSAPDFPLKITVTRNAATLTAQATGQGAFPLEATAPDKFKFDAAGVVMEFDAAKNQMTLKQGGRETVFTKENPGE